MVLCTVVWDAGCGSLQRPGRGLSQFISLFDAQGNVWLQGAFDGVTGGWGPWRWGWCGEKA